MVGRICSFAGVFGFFFQTEEERKKKKKKHAFKLPIKYSIYWWLPLLLKKINFSSSCNMTNQQLSYDTTLLSRSIPQVEESENKPAFVPVEWAKGMGGGGRGILLLSPAPKPCYLSIHQELCFSVCPTQGSTQVGQTGHPSSVCYAPHILAQQIRCIYIFSPSLYQSVIPIVQN